MLYNFKDRALMGFKNNTFAKKSNTILTVYSQLEAGNLLKSPLITHSQIPLTLQDGGRV